MDALAVVQVRLFFSFPCAAKGHRVVLRGMWLGAIVVACFYGMSTQSVSASLVFELVIGLGVFFVGDFGARKSLTPAALLCRLLELGAQRGAEVPI